MYFRVTGTAQRHQIAELTATALRHRFDVVNLLGGCQLSLFQTHLAQWVLTYVSAADLFPRSAVMLIGIGTAFVLVVTAPCRLFVFLAVLTDTQVRTAGKGTGSLGFCRHWVHHHSVFFADYIIPQRGYCKIVDFTVKFPER